MNGVVFFSCHLGRQITQKLQKDGKKKKASCCSGQKEKTAFTKFFHLMEKQKNCSTIIPVGWWNVTLKNDSTCTRCNFCNRKHRSGMFGLGEWKYSEVMTSFFLFFYCLVMLTNLFIYLSILMHLAQFFFWILRLQDHF